MLVSLQVLHAQKTLQIAYSQGFGAQCKYVLSVFAVDLYNSLCQCGDAAGSVDEEGTEQGIAHMIEHVVLLGSKEQPTGVVCNAYTGFHHTVYPAHAPLTKGTTRRLLPEV